MYSYSWKRRFGDSVPDDLEEPILSIGEDIFTYTDTLEKLRTRRMGAVRILNKALQKFKPESVTELAYRITVADLFACDGVGITTLYVWLNVLTYKGIDVDAWLSNEKSAWQMYNMRPKRKKRRRRRKY
jgi:hypothetical protein